MIGKTCGHYRIIEKLGHGGWKDADSDIPILKEAKAEYEKLK